MRAPATLTHSLPMHPFSTPENIRKPSGFLILSEVEKESLGENGLKMRLQTDLVYSCHTLFHIWWLVFPLSYTVFSETSDVMSSATAALFMMIQFFIFVCCELLSYITWHNSKIRDTDFALTKKDEPTILQRMAFTRVKTIQKGLQF